MGKLQEKWLERFNRDLKYNEVNPEKSESAKMTYMTLLICTGTAAEDLHDSLPNPARPTATQAASWTI